MSLPSVVYVSRVPDGVKPGHRLHGRPHTAQIYNKRTSTDLNLVTASSTVHEPAEDGLKNGPKYVGANFKCFLSVLM